MNKVAATIERPSVVELDVGYDEDDEQHIFWRFTPRGETAAAVFWHAVARLPEHRRGVRKGASAVLRGSAAVLLGDMIRSIGLRLVCPS